MNNTTPSRAVFLIIILLIIGILSACQPSSVEPETLVYGLTLSPSGIDPHLNASAELGIPLSSVYDTLVFYNQETDEFVPGLAESWTVSDDGLTYTFHLRDDVRFHDGTTFDAEAVRANFEYTLDTDHHSQKAASMLGPIESVDVPDQLTVVIQLEEPFAPLLNSLAQVYLGMASPTALEEWGSDEYQFHQVGTGPYKFIEYVPNGHIILEKNPDYAWAPEIYQRETARIERIEFGFYEDPARSKDPAHSPELFEDLYMRFGIRRYPYRIWKPRPHYEKCRKNRLPGTYLSFLGGWSPGSAHRHWPDFHP